MSLRERKEQRDEGTKKSRWGFLGFVSWGFGFLTLCSVVVIMMNRSVCAQPSPGDVFREYTWYNSSGDAGGALRVGGREGTTDWNTEIIGDHWVTREISLWHEIDLDEAVRAEIQVEKILCHDGTKGLAIQVNDQEWIDVPEAEGIPVPQWEYMHHIYPTVAIPLSYLNSGGDNAFRMRVSTEHSWSWPQNLIYGMHIRVYYDPTRKPHPTGRIVSPIGGMTAGESVEIEVDADSPNGAIDRVDFLAHYEDVNFEGDGVYRQWHYHFFHGNLIHHLGSAKASPFRITWDTSWVPDQDEPMQIAARVIDRSGLIYFTEPVRDLDLVREGYSVELCKPYRVPKRWVTRKTAFDEAFDITGDLVRATGYQLIWTSWSPGYMNGISINGTEVFDKEGPKYQYYAHRVTLEDVAPLKKGENILRTGLTPKYDGQMVHGMEVQWPGIMVLVRYDASAQDVLEEENRKEEEFSIELDPNRPNPFNAQTTIGYRLPVPAQVDMTVHNALGGRVVTLIRAHRDAGCHTVDWDGRDERGQSVGAGVYLVRLKAGDRELTRKMLLVK